MGDMSFQRRDVHNKRDACVFCGCRHDEADIRRVRNEHKETEFACTDCLGEPEVVNWMQAGGYSLTPRRCESA